MKQFSLTEATETVKFKIDNDDFEAIPANRLAAGALAKYFEQVNDGKIFEAHMIFFETVLTEESYKLFDQRMHSKDWPITMQMMADVSSWLLGDVYMGGKASDSDTSSGTGQ